MEKTLAQKIAEALRGWGHEVLATGTLTLGRQEFPNAVLYLDKSRNEPMYYVPGEVPATITRDRVIFEGSHGRLWYCACYAPKVIEDRVKQYHPFGPWFGIFSSDYEGLRFGDRGGKRTVRKLRWALKESFTYPTQAAADKSTPGENTR